ncbi:MAG: hypothetical protein Q8N73_02760 [bacterium]|nr:hypothetical protein [bacterium]
MPIKKSYLEQKWYYRVAKVLFLIIPFLVALLILLGGVINNGVDALPKYIVYTAIGLVLYFLILKAIWRGFLYIVFGGLEDDTKKKVSEATQSVNPATSVNPAAQVVPAIILVAVFAIFALSQAGYIKLPRINLNSGQSSHTYGASCSGSDGKTGLYGTNGDCYTCPAGATAVTNPINNSCSNGIAGVYCCSTAGGNNGGNGGSKCIPTGCGSLWHCSGSYYLGGQQIRVNGCFPVRMGDVYSGWSGTCRQCP